MAAITSDLTDEQVVARVLDGDTALYEIVMRRYNQRLYRVTRAILRDGDEAEETMQEAWVRAYQHLNQFAGSARFSTWLTRIAVNTALARMQGRRRFLAMGDGEEDGGRTMDDFKSPQPDPEASASGAETRALLESAIDALPETYRSVFVMREVEGMTTAETATCLEVSEENVKVRLHRSRRMLRDELYARAGARSAEAFQFLGARCDRIVRAVLARIASM
jgi:RNA polymerase sigma-70 factor (ECF subfamily)